jgi:predicted AAA+ superfamily ATPase
MEGDSSNPNGRVRASEPWIEKYRPARLDDIIAHKEIVGTIQRLIDSNQMPHLLLYGPPGTGKTSTILAIAKKLFGSSYRLLQRRCDDVFYLNHFAGSKFLSSMRVMIVSSTWFENRSKTLPLRALFFPANSSL